jgi:hypothetical protein
MVLWVGRVMMSADDDGVEWAEQLEGRIRAIEMVLAELATVPIVEAARERLKTNARGRPGSMEESAAKLRESVSVSVDGHGERALDNLKYAIKSRGTDS